MAKILVNELEIRMAKVNGEDYICITDIAKRKTDDPTAVIGNWMRNRNTIEYLGTWETLYNPNFNPIEFEGFNAIDNDLERFLGLSKVSGKDKHLKPQLILEKYITNGVSTEKINEFCQIVENLFK